MGSLGIIFAAAAGVCFVSGLAIISDKGVKHHGEARHDHANVR